MRSLRLLLLLTSGILHGLPGPAFAAPLVLSDTDVRDLPPSANGRTYRLYVAFPPSYASQPTRRFPVLYHLDGYWDFPLILMSAGNLRVDGAVPEMLIVGIGYAGDSPQVEQLRALDYTPGVDPRIDPSGRASGKADEFLNVIAHEIIPLVEREYRGEPEYRVLAGSSYGGLFTVHAALERPSLFQAYVACSPALWWRNQALQQREAERASEAPAWPIRLFLAYATEDSPLIQTSTASFYRQMRSRSYIGLATGFREIEGERHSSLKAETYTRGLRFAFAPRAPRPAEAGTTDRARLVNISTRGMVGSGDQRLIAGFVVHGQSPKRVLVRAAGPALEPLEVAGVLHDPRVEVVNSSGMIVAQNDNWSGADVSAAISRAGAFAFSPGSRDAALVTVLDPGAYTAVVSGGGQSEGNALVEVYELR